MYEMTYDGSKHREEVGQTLAISQREGLPKQQAPAQEQVHIARSLIERLDRDLGLLCERDED